MIFNRARPTSQTRARGMLRRGSFVRAVFSYPAARGKRSYPDTANLIANKIASTTTAGFASENLPATIFASA